MNELMPILWSAEPDGGSGEGERRGDDERRRAERRGFDDRRAADRRQGSRRGSEE